MKKTLAVLILAILVLSALPILTIPKAKADASEAKVLNDYTWYVAPAQGLLASKAGDLVVIGEVQNVGSGIIQNVTLSATAIDSNGTSLGTASTQNGQGTVFTYQTVPQAKAPFVIDFTSSGAWSSEVANVEITVLSVIDATSPPYQGLQVPSPAFNISETSGLLTGGTIENRGTETMNYVWVVTTFYNSAQKVVGLNFTNYVVTPLSPLKPSQAIYWRATPIDNTATLSNSIASFSYVIDSIPYTGGGSQGQGTPTPTGGNGTGSSSEPFPLLAVIVVVVIVVVAVVALMLLRKRPQAQPETETLPPPPPPPLPEA